MRTVILAVLLLFFLAYPATAESHPSERTVDAGETTGRVLDIIENSLILTRQ